MTTSTPLDTESAVLVSERLSAILEEFDDAIEAGIVGELDPEAWRLVWKQLQDDLSTLFGDIKRAHDETDLAAAHFRLAFCRNVLNNLAGGAR